MLEPFDIENCQRELGLRMVNTIDEIVAACVRDGVFTCRDVILGSTRVLKFIGAEDRWGDFVTVSDTQEAGRVIVLVDFSRQPAEQQQQQQ